MSNDEGMTKSESRIDIVGQAHRLAVADISWKPCGRQAKRPPYNVCAIRIRASLVIRAAKSFGASKKKAPAEAGALRLRQIKPIGAYAVPPPNQAHPRQSGLESPARARRR